MPYKIDPDKCVSCGACAGVCSAGAIAAGDGKYRINAAACISCGVCAGMCPMGAIAVDVPMAKVVDITPPATPTQAA